MEPVVLPPITDEKQLERQMSCMAGFLQLFDRHQRMYAPKSLASSGSTSPSETSERPAFRSSPESRPQAPSLLPLPVFDSWKLREAPRLSLDSRLRPRDPRPVPPPAARADAAVEKNRRPTTVVVRLMGLDTLPELRRSASDSRVSGDPYRFVDESLVPKPAPDPIPVSRSKTPPPLPATNKGLFHSPGGRRSSNADNTPPTVVLKPPATRSEPAKGIHIRRPVSPDPNPRNVQSWAARSPEEETRFRSPHLLDRCDELLRSLAAIASAEQPSPVSVLDLSFLGEGSSPPRTAKRSITEWYESIPDVVAAAAAEDLGEVTANAIGKDMAGGDHGWAGNSAEMTDAVALHIERLVFEDLVAKTVGDLADVVAGGKCLIPWRRELVF